MDRISNSKYFIDEDEKRIDKTINNINKRISKPSICLLIAWMVENHLNPYPSVEDKYILSEKTNLTPQQIGTWMTNMRKRHMLPIINGKRQAKNRLDHLFLALRDPKIDKIKMEKIITAIKMGSFFKTTRHRYEI
jgi:hypothetical protein